MGKALRDGYRDKVFLMTISGTEGLSADLAQELARRGLELGPVVGRGAMSVVYRAFDAKHQRSLAVKVLKVEAADREGLARWSREVSAAARLRHPNIVPLIDSGTTGGGTAYFLMPLAEGETLQSRLQRGPLAIAEAIQYAREIAEALAYAHAEGLVHRDVKPGNILLERGHAALADFGLARPIRADDLDSGRLTQVGMVVGTPAYMSPEQLTAGAVVDGRSDLFSLGVVLYEMVTGRLPFEATTMPGLMTERLSGAFRRVAALRPGVPSLLQEIVARALAPDPQERYDSAEAMVADLQLVERELSGGRPAPEAPIRSPRRAWIAGGLVALTALVIGLAARSPASLRLDPSRIVVADFRNEAGDTAATAIGALASDLISARLATIPGLTVINSDLVLGASRQGSQRRITGGLGNGLRVLVDATRAATVVSGSYYLESGRLEVFVEITDARTGQVLLDLGPLRGRPARPDSVLAQARDSVVAFMTRWPPPP